MEARPIPVYEELLIWGWLRQDVLSGGGQGSRCLILATHNAAPPGGAAIHQGAHQAPQKSA